MPAPQVTFTVDEAKLSAHRHVTVRVVSDLGYTAFEARATRAGDVYGWGKGRLIASFSVTPPETSRTFEIYDRDIVEGDGSYRISLFARGADGSTNDNAGFTALGGGRLKTIDGKAFLAIRKG